MEYRTVKAMRDMLREKAEKALFSFEFEKKTIDYDNNVPCLV